MARSSLRRLISYRPPFISEALRISCCGHDKLTISAANAPQQLQLIFSDHAANTRDLRLQKLQSSGQYDFRGNSPSVAADAFTVALVACLGVSAVGGTYILFKGPGNKVIKVSLKADEATYLCEGHSSILCAYRGLRPDWRGRLLQLAKEAGGKTGQEDAITSFRRRAEIPRLLSLHLFDRNVIDSPELVSLPEGLVSQLDATFFSSRPAELRNQKLRQDEGVRQHGEVLALRSSSLFEAPPCLRHSWTGSVAESARLPSLTVEFRPGCGLQEVASLPSRDAIRMQMLLGGSSALPQELDPLALYSGEVARGSANLRARLRASFETAAIRIFQDGRPVHPSAMPAESSADSPEKASQVDLAGVVRSCGIKCSVDDLLGAVAKVLASGRSPLADLRHLQCFAAGESEKIADRLFKDLQKHTGQDCIAALSSTESIQAAIRNAAKRESDTDRMEKHLKRGHKLMVVATEKWGDRQVSEVKDWLALFLLGRTCFEARLLVSFAVVPENIDSANLKQMRKFRFRPLHELLPGRPWSHNVWVCVTVTGLERCDPSQIPNLATDLEDLVRLHSTKS